MSSRLIISISCSLALLLPAALLAQQAPRHPPEGSGKFRDLDKNGDGRLGPEEFQNPALLDSISDIPSGGQRPPNIVVILADDLGYGDTNAYGSESIPTPHIDALAHGGARLTNAYVTAASCSPSRAGLMTGRYQQRFGFEFNTSGGQITHSLYRGLHPAATTLADVLKKAGYVLGLKEGSLGRHGDRELQRIAMKAAQMVENRVAQAA